MLAETPKLLLLGKENLGVSPMPVSIGIQALGNGNLVTYLFATKVQRRFNINGGNTYLIDFYFKDCRRGGLLSDNSSLPECELSPEPNPGVLMIIFLTFYK